MRPASTLLVAFVVVVATVPVGVGAAASIDASTSVVGGSAPAQATDDGTAGQTSNGTGGETQTTSAAAPNETASANGSNAIAPGAKLAGVVAIQRTEIDSEVRSRAFGQRVAAAATNDSKAAVIAGTVNDSRERVERLRDRLAELERAHESGELPEGRYRARTAQVTAELNSVEARLDQANESASSLPASVREANGIDPSNIERLRSDARNLTGPETAEIAREIAGNDPGRGMGGPDSAPGREGDAPGREGDAPGREDDAPGREDDAPGREGDSPGREGDAPGRSDETDAANGTEDRRPEDAGNGGAERSNGPGEGAEGKDDPGREDAGNDRKEKNATRTGDGSDGSDPSESDSAGDNDDGDGDAVGQSDDAPGRSGDAPGRDRGD
jgi:hypothetical protein